MAMGDLLKPYIPQIENNNVVGINVLFRYTLTDTQKKVFCHVDGCSYAGLLYLSKPEDCAGGSHAVHAGFLRQRAASPELPGKARYPA
jgi:hypothetical protein